MWVPLVALEVPAVGQLARGEAFGRGLVVVNHRGCLRALEDRCPHLDVRLSQVGWLNGDRIVCAWHAAAVDVITGHCEGYADLQTFPIEVRSDGVYVRVDDKAIPPENLPMNTMTTPTDPISTLLQTRAYLIADGAMGTNLFLLGLANGAPGELWNVEQPDSVRSVYQGFVDAGSDIILTNTFGANRFRFALHGLQGRVREMNQAAAALARDVADRAGRQVLVAGDMGPTGDVLEPLGPRTASEAEEAFHEQAEALREGGAHVAWIETMFAEAELEAAVRGAHRAGLPVVATMTFDTGGRTMMGVRPSDAMRSSKNLPVRPIAFGANCGIGPAQLLDSVLGLAQGAEPGDVIVAKSNCGLPVMGDDMKVRYDGTPEVMANYARLARNAGARIIGGCCGTTPLHVRAMVDELARSPREAAPSYEDVERLLGPIRKNTTSPDEGNRRRRTKTT